MIHSWASVQRNQVPESSSYALSKGMEGEKKPKAPQTRIIHLGYQNQE